MPLANLPVTAFNLLVGIALVLAVVAIIKPAWPLLPIAVVLVCIALLVKAV